jgi:hypothetical protein
MSGRSRVLVISSGYRSCRTLTTFSSIKPNLGTIPRMEPGTQRRAKCSVFGD